jgi:hypothetical protein
MAKPVCAACFCAMLCLLVGAASAQAPIGLNWIEQLNLARDSHGTLLDANAFATVIWDKDGSGLAGWTPSDPIPVGDEAVLDINDLLMTAPFGSGTFAGQMIGTWTADDSDGWTQDGEWLYLLAYVPAAYSSSGQDEYGVSSLVQIVGWPNNPPVSHDIVGGGPITTMPIPEPATLLVAALGLGALALRRK